MSHFVVALFQIDRLTLTPNQRFSLRRLAPSERGVRVVTNVGCGMRWTLERRKTSGVLADGRSRVVLTPRRWRQVSRKLFREATVAKEPGHRGEHEVNRKPSRREGRVNPVNLWRLCSCGFFISHARLRVQRASGFPCALAISQGPRMPHQLGVRIACERERMSGPLNPRLAASRRKLSEL